MPEHFELDARALAPNFGGVKRSLVALLLVLAPSTVWAAGWLQPGGRCYGKLWNRSMFGSRVYAAGGLREFADVPSYQDHQVNLYAECGVHPWVTVTFSAVPAGYAKSGDKSTFYMGPFVAGARVGILRSGSLRLAAAARYGYAPPVGDEPLTDTTIELQDGRQVRAIYQPALENHRFVLAIELGKGFRLGSVPSFVSASLGVRFNTASSMDHAIIGSVQWGVTLWRKLVLDMHTNLYEPFFQEVPLTNTSGVGQTRYLGLGLGASFWFIDPLAVFITADGVIYAESNAATPALMAGLETRFGGP